METVEERVARGAAWMDEHIEYWRNVKPEDVEMDQCAFDVRSLATGSQVKVGYDEAETAWEFAHGFWPDSEDEWDDLTRAWREQLV